MTDSPHHDHVEQAATEPVVEAATEPAAELAVEPATSVPAERVEAGPASAAEHDDELARLRDELGALRSRRTAQDSFAASAEAVVAELRQTAEGLAGERLLLEREKSSLVAREERVARAEHQRDQGYAHERTALETELSGRRRDALTALEAELIEVRTKRLAEVAEAENSERERVRGAIEDERAAWEKTRLRQQRSLTQQQEEFERHRGAVSALESDLVRRRAELDGEELDLEQRRGRAQSQAQRRSERLDAEVADRMADERTSFQESLQTSRDHVEELRRTIRSQEDLLSTFEQLRQQLGGRDPGEVILELNTLRDDLAHKAEELASRPTREVRDRFDAMERELRTAQNRAERLAVDLASQQALAAQASEFKRQNGTLQAELQFAEQRASTFEAAADAAMAELSRLRAAYEKPAEVEARRRDIELPRFETQDITPTTQGDIGENEWLQGIATASDDYGLHFNPRILKAFHTALKTAEWSPLTVLAGVSGTGKSELPRLYSHFGGLYFEPLSVQPNWDSQESMLGFFNSIDNRFDAQPVLRFLAQSQKPWTAASDDQDGYPGLADAVCMVLLDEMNLAHPELYFAEFLSKLELRRGKKGTDVPTLPVKIGAGMLPYELPLGRNVLWAGTMNQDETTKSLSDKVLDRAIVIHFPRPTELKRRQRLAPLDSRNRGDNLPVKTWQSWLVRESTFTEDEVRPYKSFIEEMNGSLDVAGRAIGHRVWQGIEYYMANYPDVRSAGDDSARKLQAMHVAFEDQLVQKVMPKLRGIDTRGRSKTDCLDKIREQLVAGIDGHGFNLAADFELATQMGHGQFIWQSANYLRVESQDEPA